jgi:hypothetical protein
MLALFLAVSALGAAATGLQRSGASDHGRRLDHEWEDHYEPMCDQCFKDVKDDCKYRMADADCMERNGTCTDLCDFEGMREKEEMDDFKYEEEKRPREHQGCWEGEGVILYNRLVVPVTYMGHSSMQHVPCPSGYVGSVALICIHGRISIAANGCRPDDSDMCSKMANACGKMSHEYEEVFFAELDAANAPKECKDEKRQQKCDLVKERNLCDRETWAESCMATCGFCA